MEKIFGKPLITHDEIVHRIRELGIQITADYAQKNLILIGVLKGAYAFVADLSRAIGLPAGIDFIMTSTNAHGEKTISTPTMDLRSADVLVIEDIIDSGVTAKVILEQLTKLGHKVDKSEVVMGEGPIRHTGEFEIHVHLHADVHTIVKVTVAAEE